MTVAVACDVYPTVPFSTVGEDGMSSSPVMFLSDQIKEAFGRTSLTVQASCRVSLTCRKQALPWPLQFLMIGNSWGAWTWKINIEKNRTSFHIDITFLITGVVKSDFSHCPRLKEQNFAVIRCINKTLQMISHPLLSWICKDYICYLVGVKIDRKDGIRYAQA